MSHSESENLVSTNNAIYPEVLLYPFGDNRPALNDVQIREFVELVDANGGWPFAKSAACAEFESRYYYNDRGWFPREQE